MYVYNGLMDCMLYFLTYYSFFHVRRYYLMELNGLEATYSEVR